MKRFVGYFIGNVFLKSRVYAALVGCAGLFVLRFFINPLGLLPGFAILLLTISLILDYIFLFSSKQSIHAARSHADRFSNGDDNIVRIDVHSFYNFPVSVELIDEIPQQFQRRDILFKVSLKPNGSAVVEYILRPVKRGEYQFGTINSFVSSPLGFIQRRQKFEATRNVPVYPSYLQLRKYHLLAIHDRLSEAGVKKIRRIGHSMEFEQIKEYVIGDDYRTVNWKATARRGQLMVNHFADEKSQQIYCLIDKGRVMKMPFEGLSLLDYAINASLVLSNVALLKQDKAGVITFSEKIESVVKAEKKALQMQSILEMLYNQKTRYLETDFERLYSHIRTRINQRSLLILFTNFESMTSLNRQLPYLRKIAKHHLLLVVFFENTELKVLTEKPAPDVESVYLKTIGEKFSYEKKLIVKELQRYGISSILTAPKNITINTVNKYLELKSRQLI